jgi:hypothetical protein
MKHLTTSIRHLATTALLGFVAALTVPETQAVPYTFQEINYPGEDSTSFSAINDSGLIAGSFGTETPEGDSFTAFTYDGQAFSTFSVPGAWGTFARGINSAGIVVGEFGLTGGGGGAFSYDGTTFTIVNYLGGPETSTSFDAINDSGLIAGVYGSETPEDNSTSFTYDGQSFSTFSVPGAWGTFARGINSDGVIVGEFGRDSGGGAFIARPVPEPTSLTLALAGVVTLLSRRNGRQRNQKGAS